jgi:GT2 family glycosyltransferase
VTGAPVSALIVNFRSTDWLLPCLESLLDVGPDLTRVIVVDNASGDGSIERIHAWAEGREMARSHAAPALDGLWQPPLDKPIPVYTSAADGDVDPAARLVLIAANANRGFAAGNNIGLRYIEACRDASDVWLLNPDVLVAPGALRAMRARMAEDQSIGTCGALLRYLELPDHVQCYGGAWFKGWTAQAGHLGEGHLFDDDVDPELVERHLAYVMGACLLASRAYLNRVGPMDERFFLYFEEMSWQVRAGRRFKAAFAAEADVYHHHHASGGRHDRLLYGGRLRFARYYRPWTLPTVAAGVLGAAWRAWRQGESARARMLASRSFWWEALTRPGSAPG